MSGCEQGSLSGNVVQDPPVRLQQLPLLFTWYFVESIKLKQMLNDPSGLLLSFIGVA